MNEKAAWNGSFKKLFKGSSIAWARTRARTYIRQPELDSQNRQKYFL